MEQTLKSGERAMAMKMKIGELAKADRLHHQDDTLLRAHGAAGGARTHRVGYRLYGHDDVERLEFIEKPVRRHEVRWSEGE